MVTIDLDIGDMLRVTSVTPSGMVFAARAPIQVHQAVIIPCSDHCLIFGHLNDVDVAAISASWEDSVDKPSKLDGVASPVCRCGVAGSAWVLLFVIDIEEQKLVRTTTRPNLLSIN